MRYSKLTKAITLIFFVGMLTTFLLYRMGMFDKQIIGEAAIQQSPNGSVLKTAANDTTIKPKQSLIKRQPRMTSTKVVVVTDDLYIVKEDDSVTRKKVLKNLQQEQKLNANKDSVKKKDYFFSGSKSSAIFTPTADSKLFDSLLKSSLKFDTITSKKPKKKTKQ